ncbi:MAG: hypothetical protein RIS94_388 [Pseudomonadota bacterium]|jgi:O-antigen/teichoic acid export membrane protein
MESQKVIARGAGSNAASFVIRFGARASFLWVAARLYGAAPYGVFSMASTMVELAAPLAGLGLRRMIFPWLEQEAEARGAPHVLLDALLLTLLASAIVTLCVWAGVAALPAGTISAPLRFALFALAPAVLGQAVADVAFAATRWTHRMRYEVLGRGLVEPYALTAVTLTAWFAGGKAEGLVIAYAAASALVALFALWSARHCLGEFALVQWRPHLLRARLRTLLSPSGTDFLVALSQRIDLALVGFLLGDAAAGVYNVLRQLRTPILQVRQAFDGILTPLTARTMHADGDVRAGEAMAAATRVILTIQLGVVLLMTAAGAPLLALFGPQYPAAWPALVAIVLTEAVNGAFGVSELILYYRRPALALQVNLVLIAVPAVLIPLVAPRFGLLGAGLTMLLAGIAAMGLRRFWLERLGVHRTAMHAAPPIFAALAGAAAWLALNALLSGLTQPWVRLCPPLSALLVYAALIQAWRKRSPDALSMASFRVG